MSAKRPRPAIPVLVHVDNPTEAASVVVDTSTIEGKMDTVITNQNRIYDKIPTSSGGGGGSTDMTTVNANTTALATAIGTTDSTTGNNDLLGLVKNIRGAIGILGTGLPLSSDSVRSFLYNMREGIGNSASDPSLTGNTVRDLLMQIKTTTGPITSGLADNNLFGFVKNISASVGDGNSIITANATHLRSLLYNIRQAVGSSTSTPTIEGTTVRDLLTAIKENTASGGSGGGGGSADLTTVNEKTTALAAAIGSASDSSSTVSVIGLLKSITDKY